jgi:hypothetical protein
LPTIAIFFGVTVQMYWRDHPPPHIHVFYGGAEALVAIATGEVIGGALPPGAARMIRERVADRREALLANWERARLREPLEQVPGADVL